MFPLGLCHACIKRMHAKSLGAPFLALYVAVQYRIWGETVLDITIRKPLWKFMKNFSRALYWKLHAGYQTLSPAPAFMLLTTPAFKATAVFQRLNKSTVLDSSTHKTSRIQPSKTLAHGAANHGLSCWKTVLYFPCFKCCPELLEPYSPALLDYYWPQDFPPALTGRRKHGQKSRTHWNGSMTANAIRPFVSRVHLSPWISTKWLACAICACGSMVDLHLLQPLVIGTGYLIPAVGTQTFLPKNSYTFFSGISWASNPSSLYLCKQGRAKSVACIHPFLLSEALSLSHRPSYIDILWVIRKCYSSFFPSLPWYGAMEKDVKQWWYISFCCPTTWKMDAYSCFLHSQKMELKSLVEKGREEWDWDISTQSGAKVGVGWRCQTWTEWLVTGSLWES